MIQHQFEITISGTEISGTVSFSRISARFRNTKMTQERKDVFKLLVSKRATSPIQISIDEATIEVNDLVDRLMMIDGHNITSLTYKGYINEVGNLIIEKENHGFKFEASLKGLINDPQKFYEHEDRKAIFNKTDNLGVLRIYRTALSVSDNISKYLILYGILLIMNREKQKAVDEFIIKKLPDILIIRGKHGDETIITNIRNLIAHPTDGLDMGQLSKDVNLYIETLRDLVLKGLKS